MNFRRAILRLWLVVSVTWVSGVVLLTALDGEMAHSAGLVWTVALVPPLLLRLVLAAAGWVIAGLIDPRSN
jgi:hypothetical protein